MATKVVTTLAILISLATTVYSQGTTLWECKFETQDTFCSGLTIVSGANANWVRATGSSPSSSTGPNSAQEGSYYALFESSAPVTNGESTSLLTQSFTNQNQQRLCIRFYYHMYGANMGSLTLSAVDGNTGQTLVTLFTRAGDQGNQWLFQEVEYFVPTTNIRFEWKAIRGNDYRSDMGLDNALIRSGQCSQTPTPAPTSGLLPYGCDFDDSSRPLCDFVQGVNDQFDWVRRTGETPTTGTGPSSAQSEPYYMYIEVSTPRQGIDPSAVLFMPPMVNAGTYPADVCLSYYYHMFDSVGNEMGRLEIYTEQNPGNRRTISGDQGNQWRIDRVDLQLLSSADRVAFRGVQGPQIRGDVAIDSVTMTLGRCDAVVTPSLPFVCSFEQPTVCGSMQRTDDNFDWTRQTGRTDTLGTGPDAARSGSYYMYTEASQKNNGDFARLDLPAINFVGSVCVKFWYHMYGVSMGTLKLYTTDRISNPYWSISGNRGTQWNYQEVTLYYAGAGTKIGFEASRGTNIESDIAIDEVSITAGTCQGSPSLPFRCTFEFDFCNILQLTNDNSDMVRNAGIIPSSQYGPSQAYAGQWYIYLTSPNVFNDQFARVELPQFNVAGDVCLSLFYHMYGPTTTARFSILTNMRDGGGLANPWVVISGNQGNTWRFGQWDLNLKQGDKIVLEAVRGSVAAGDVAIDDLQVTQGRCQGSTPTPTPAPPTGNIPFTCDFEQASICGLQQRTDDETNMVWKSGGTDSVATGPSQAYRGNYYIYLEASGLSTGSRARVDLPSLNYVGTVCLSFYYHMYGSAMGTLKTYTTERPGGGISNPWDTIGPGDQGNNWLQKRITLVLSSGSDRIGFEATRGIDIQSDISIDELRVDYGACSGTPTPTPTPPPPTPNNLPWSCDFSFNDICQMVQRTDDIFDATVYFGSTPTGGTGPSGAQSGQYYIYFEADNRDRGDYAVVEFPSINYNGRVCLSYWYHMWGDQGALYVYTTFRTLQNPWRAITGNKGNQWIQDFVSLDIQGPNDKISWYVQTGNPPRSDTAIDNIRLTQGNCQGVTTPAPPTSDLPYACDFEQGSIGSCRIDQANNDGQDFIINSGGTPTFGTGPSGAQSGTYYIYMEATNNPQGSSAVMYLPELRTVGDVCVSFYYHMQGSAQSVMYIYGRSSGINNAAKTIWGDKGPNWQYERFVVSLMNIQDTIAFFGVTGADIAIDNIRVERGSCTTAPTPSPPTPQPPVASLPYYCPFGFGDTCSMVNVIVDNFDWVIFSGRTSTPGTGPSQAQEGQYYLYLEADGRFTGDNAIIELPVFNYIGTVCLSYYYHMYGAEMGELLVTTSDRTATSPWRRIVGDQGNQWIFDRVTLDLPTARSRIGFYGIIRVDQGMRRSDIAIDTVRVQAGSCSGTNVPFRCGFEQSVLCGMSQWTNDQFDWRPQQYNTDTGGTGPDNASEGIWFLYIESSDFNRRNYDRSYIETPSLQYSGPTCLRFRYHMYGRGIGRLIAYQNSRSESNPLWSLSGNRGNQWNEAVIDLTLNFNEKVVFMAELSGSGDFREGDIALDDVQVLPGQCSSVTPSPTTTTTTTEPPSGVIRSDYYTCDGESSTTSPSMSCRIRNLNTNDSPSCDWLRTTGRTPSAVGQNRQIDGRNYPVTGPERAYDGNSYLYVEATNTNAGDICRVYVEGSDLQRPGAGCLTFAYTMNGHHMGTLRVFIRRGGGPRIYVWEMNGDQLQDWERAAVDISNPSEVGFEAELTGKYSSDFAIDGINYRSGKCEFTPSPYIWVAPFEISSSLDSTSALFGMEQDTTDQFDWKLMKGSTKSDVTGPDGAQNGEYYIYAEGSKPRRTGDRAVIMSPPIPTSGEVCLTFWYNMFGFHMGRLDVFLSNGGFDRRGPFWSMQGDQGPGWKQARQTLSLSNNDMIVFQATQGTEYSSDMAIDNITVQPSRCF